MSKQTIDEVLDSAFLDMSDVDAYNTKGGTNAHWTSFDDQLQCEDYGRFMGYGEDTYNAIQEYLSEQNSALY